MYLSLTRSYNPKNTVHVLTALPKASYAHERILFYYKKKWMSLLLECNALMVYIVLDFINLRDLQYTLRIKKKEENFKFVKLSY